MVVLRSWAARRWYVLTAGPLAALLAAGLLGVAPGNAASTMPAGTQSAVAKRGTVAAGRLVQAATSNKPFVPTKAQIAARARDMAMLASLKKPPIGAHTTAANVAQLRGPQTSPTTSRTPTSFTVFNADGSNRHPVAGQAVGAFTHAVRPGLVLQHPSAPVATTVTAANGRFAFHGLRPGRYFITIAGAGPSIAGHWVVVTAERGATVLLTQCLNCTGPLSQSG